MRSLWSFVQIKIGDTRRMIRLIFNNELVNVGSVTLTFALDGDINKMVGEMN